MHLQFTYTFNDYAEASVTGSRLGQVRTILILVVLLLISLTIVMTLDETSHSLKWVVSNLYPYLFLFVLISPWGMRLVNYLLWKIRGSLHKVITYEINDRSVIAATDTWRSEMKWETFARFVETRNVFVLYTNGYVFYMLPKRAFESAGALAEFRELAQRKVTPGKWF